jgi:hypothetical protein
MLKLLNFFKKSLLAVAGLVVALQVQASSDVPVGVEAWPQSTAALKSGAKTAGYSAEQQKELREAQKALKQAEKEEKAAEKQARKARKQARISENLEKSKANEQFRLEQERAQRAAIDQEMQERQEQRLYAAQQADPKFQAKRIAESRQNELRLRAEQKAQRRAIDQEILERQKMRAERAAQLEKDRADLQAWAATYEKDLAAEQRDRALFANRFAVPEPKTRYGGVLAQQEQNLVVSQAADMLRDLNQKEAAAHATILKNSGMFSGLFVSPQEKLMRAKRKEQAERELRSIWTRREELDAALDQQSVADQLAELEYVQERIDNDPNLFSLEKLAELERAEEAQRERDAQLRAEQARTRGEKKIRRQGQISRSEAAFGQEGAGAEQPELAAIPEPTVGSVDPETTESVAMPEGEGEEYKQAERERDAQELAEQARTRGEKTVKRQRQKSRYTAFGDEGADAEQPELAAIPEPTVGSVEPATTESVAMPEGQGEEYKQAEEKAAAQQPSAVTPEPSMGDDIKAKYPKAGDLAAIIGTGVNKYLKEEEISARAEVAAGGSDARLNEILGYQEEFARALSQEEESDQLNMLQSLAQGKIDRYKHAREQAALVGQSEAAVSPEDLERYGQSEFAVQDFPPAVEQLENLGLDQAEESAALAQPSPAPELVTPGVIAEPTEKTPVPSKVLPEFLKDSGEFEEGRAQATTY